jgi:hypothetical protein
MRFLELLSVSPRVDAKSLGMYNLRAIISRKVKGGLGLQRLQGAWWNGT